MSVLFSIGTIAASSSSGTISGLSYSLFEPNNGCSSNSNYSTLVHEFENKTLFTRQTALPFQSIVYEYENIWTKEFNQIRQFVDFVDDALTSFWVVDWSKGQDPTSFGSWGTSTVIAIDDTSLYSTIANYKSNNVLIWDGGNWKIGNVGAISTNTSITVNITGNNYGDLTQSSAASGGYMYPIYTCYLSANTLAGFSRGTYIDRPVSLTGIGGFMYSGSITFRGKYKI